MNSNAPDLTASATDLASLKRKFGLYSMADMEKVRDKIQAQSYVVKDLIPHGSVNIAAGDSGIGKSPFFYQMCICVAAGIPFLGFPVRQGLALYCDYENGLATIGQVCGAQKRFLGLAAAPENLIVWPPTTDSVTFIEPVISALRPVLCVIDSLRSFDPQAEEKSKQAALCLTNLRRLARRYGAAFVLIHHTRKPGEGGSPALEETPTRTWLLQACGSRALVNQTDVRIGLDTTSGLERIVADTNHGGMHEVALVMKSFERMRGESGTTYLAREYDEHGEPLGYRALTGIELLFNADQQNTFAILPVEFSFKVAKQLYGRADQATSDFLKKCMRIGMLRQTSHGHYSKNSLQGTDGVNGG